MADFSSFKTKRQRFDRAAGLVDRILAAYQSASGVRDELAIYQAGSDTDLTAAIDAVYTNAQKAELGQVANKLAALVADLEANHPSLISS